LAAGLRPYPLGELITVLHIHRSGILGGLLLRKGRGRQEKAGKRRGKGGEGEVKGGEKGNGSPWCPNH